MERVKMAELWELCNSRSQAVLIQLYWEEHGYYPDFWYELSGEKQKPAVTISPDIEEEELAATGKFMSQALLRGDDAG